MSEQIINQKEKIEQMQNLIVLLNQASKAYYQESREIMSNFEYDRLYDMLVELEKETGVTLSKSPTMHVGYEVLSELPKEAHPSRMLSLDKTKDRDQLVSWLGDQQGVLSWKLDGLTIVLTYEDGKLVKAVTRGNGEIGEVVTSNARMFTNLPVSIDFKGRLVLRGEAVISYPDFEKINETITDDGAKYKNPRNLCSGSVRQLSNKVTAERHVRFYGFSLVSAEGADAPEFRLRSEQMAWLAAQGFSMVQHRLVNAGSLKDAVEWFAGEIEDFIIPSDGLVLLLDDIAYGQSLGVTAKFPRDAIAFKWQDEVKETTLQEIEWSASRTGLINPVAIFEPVELEGTTVSRASVHNLSVMKELGLGIGDRIMVYKANMIIPQISENLTRSGKIHVPEACAVCGGATEIHNENGVETLFCPNPDCLAKQIKRLTLFVSRDAMDIEGLSEMTLEKLVAEGMVHELADLYHLDRYKDQIVQMEGFGEKSFANLSKAVEKSRNASVNKFLYSLGIPNIGTANAKALQGLFRQADGHLAFAVGGQDEHRLAGRHHLPHFDAAAGDHAILGRGQHGISGLVAGHVVLRAHLLVLGFGRAVGVVGAVEVRAADQLAFQQGLVAVTFGAGQLQIGLGGGHLCAHRFQLQAHVLGIEFGQALLGLDPLADLHQALGHLAADAKRQLRLEAGAHLAGEGFQQGRGRLGLNHHGRARRRLGFLAVATGAEQRHQGKGQSKRQGMTEHGGSFHAWRWICCAAHSRNTELPSPVTSA